MNEPSGTLIDFPCEDPSPIELVPLEILNKIFTNFSLPTRGKASRVCRRWHEILHSPRSSMEDVVVFNIFERTVWEKTIKNNQGVRVSTIEVADLKELSRVAKLITTAMTVKFWYTDTTFAEEAVDAIVSSGLKLKTVDLYPYSSSVITEHVHKRLPDLQGMTMRPHNHEFFWTGLPLETFPSFQSLTTLCVDTISFSEELVLPPNLTTFEFQNRSALQYLRLMDKLKDLKKLEYFSLSHADMSKEQDFIRFLDTVDARNIPSLTYLILRFCKFPETDYLYEYMGEAPEIEANEIVNKRKTNLKMLKIDLCYGALFPVGASFIRNSRLMAVLAIQIIEEAPALTAIQMLAGVAEKNKVWMHFGVMQRDTKKKYSFEPDPLPSTSKENPLFPASFFRVLSKFEASFMWRSELLDEILTGPIAAVQEIKLINCDSVTDVHLEGIAKNAPMLRRMSVINCNSTSDEGMRNFVKYFDTRRSQKLEITWKRGMRFSRPANFYLDLVHYHTALFEGKRVKFSSKVFNENSDGERVTVFEKKKNKRLIIQDFSESDGCHLIGVIVGRAPAPFESSPEETSSSMEVGPPTSPPSPPPSSPSRLLHRLTNTSSV